MHAQLGAIPLHQLVAVVDALESAVGVLHAHKIVHRDIKPANLLLFGPEENPTSLVEPIESLLLADLGVAKQLGLDSGLTAAVGTPGFRPPEQGHIATVDSRADLYSCTALVFWLLTGTAPPADPYLRRHALEDLNASGQLRQVLQRGLEPVPAERHRDVGEWATQLRTALGSPRGIERDAVTITTSKSAFPSTSGNGDTLDGSNVRRVQGAFGAAALAGLLGLGAGWGANAILNGDEGSAVQVSDAGNGLSTSELSEANIRVAITGPNVLTVG